MKKTLIKAIENEKARSAWTKGVKAYAIDLVNEADSITAAEIQNFALLQSKLLNGARDWAQYSRGGLALIANVDIAKRLCTPSELKQTQNGIRRPNKDEDWIDVQGRALYQAANLIAKACQSLDKQLKK